MFNQLKTVMLLAILTAIMLALGWLIGGQSGLIIGFIIALFINFLTYWFSDKFVLAMYRAKEADKRKHSWLHAICAEVAKKAGVPKPRVYIVPLPIMNAFATGRNPQNSVVAVTEGIMKGLSREELKGVIAHEIGHVKNRDILISTIVATVAGVIGFVAFYARMATFSGDRENRAGLIGLLLAGILAPIIAMLIQLAISRTREFIADESGAHFIGNGLPLANALLKLEGSAKKMPLRGNEATAHLFIVNPFTASAFMKLFSTHPSIEERVKRLKELKF